MGKENVFTGKVDTIAETASSNANSVGKKFESVPIPKVSKFSAKKWSYHIDTSLQIASK